MIKINLLPHREEKRKGREKSFYSLLALGLIAGILVIIVVGGVLEGLIDFVKAGKESYYIVSKFDQFEYARLAPLFGKLSEEFESCVYGLNLVKGNLDEMQHPISRQMNGNLLH